MADRPNVEEVFEAWAHVAARVRKRSPEEQQAILAGLGIGSEWAAVHEMWSKRLNEDIVAQRMDRPQRYAQICREEQLRRQRSSDGGADAFRVTGPPPPPGPAPPAVPKPPDVQLGVAGSPVLGIRPEPGGAKPPMRQRAETLDIDRPPEGDAIPFAKRGTGPRKPAATVDFRDMVTPQRVKPEFPWMLQERTTGAITGAATEPPDGSARLPSGPPPSDFRRGLAGDQPPKPPKPNQDDTASGVDLVATVEAARQVSEVMSWTVERWARLVVALEHQPHNAEALWTEQGITSPEARVHATRQWQRRLDKEPSVKAEMMGHLDRLRATLPR